MSPSLNSEVVSLSEVPIEELTPEDDFRQPVVLVVDDEPLVADTLSAILENAGFSILTAYDGRTALQLASHGVPDLLISDVAMPRMSGVELAVQLLEAIPECKVLLFSGHATSSDLVHAIDAGYDFHLLAKPLHPTEMLRHVSRSLNIEAKPRKRGLLPGHMAEVIPIRQIA